jgi:hypothetical protein
MPGLPHQFGEARALVAGGGSDAGAERLAGVAFGVELGGARGLLAQAGDRLVGEFCPSYPASPGDSA